MHYVVICAHVAHVVIDSQCKYFGIFPNLYNLKTIYILDEDLVVFGESRETTTGRIKTIYIGPTI